MNNRDLWIVRIVALLFLVAFGYGIMKFLISLKEEPVPKIVPQSTRYVQARPVSYDSYRATVKAPGRVKSLSQIDVTAEASGKIQKGNVLLKQGTSFKKGDVLFTIYQDEAKLSLQASKSQFLNALANLMPDISIDYPQEEKVFRTFFSAINIDKDLPEFPEINSDKFKIFLSSRNILGEYYNIKKDELQLERHVVKAPFNGVIVHVFLEAGAYTNTGGKVASIIQSDALEVEVALDRSDALWVKKGQQVKIFPKNKEEFFSGTVLRKGAFVEEATQSQMVYVKINSDQGNKVLAGEYLQAEFNGYMIDGVMEIPRNAVFNSNEIFTIKNGRLTKEAINIIKTNERTLFFNGLPINDTVVTQALVSVQEGIPVIMLGSEIAKKMSKKNKDQKHGEAK